MTRHFYCLWVFLFYNSIISSIVSWHFPGFSPSHRLQVSKSPHRASEYGIVEGASLGCSLLSQPSLVPCGTRLALRSQQHVLRRPRKVCSPIPKTKRPKGGGLPSVLSWELRAEEMNSQTTLTLGPSVAGPGYCAVETWILSLMFLGWIPYLQNLLFWGALSHNCVTICDLYLFIIYITWIILASSI